MTAQFKIMVYVQSGAQGHLLGTVTIKKKMCIMNKSFLIVSSYLGMNIFVAFFLLLLLLADSTPPAASTVPLIGRISHNAVLILPEEKDFLREGFTSVKAFLLLRFFSLHNIYCMLHIRTSNFHHILQAGKKFNFSIEYRNKYQVEYFCGFPSLCPQNGEI